MTYSEDMSIVQSDVSIESGEVLAKISIPNRRNEGYRW